MPDTRLRKVLKMADGMGAAIEYLERNRKHLTHIEVSRIHTMIKTGRVDQAVETITQLTAERRKLIHEQGRKASAGKGRPGV